jgi:hypothetical protein
MSNKCYEAKQLLTSKKIVDLPFTFNLETFLFQDSNILDKKEVQKLVGHYYKFHQVDPQQTFWLL